VFEKGVKQTAMQDSSTQDICW